MKAYENVERRYLTRRIPAIIRIDGRAFHTFTKGFRKPFDPVFREAMENTMMYLCENIQGCVLGYQQSDEISLVLTDYKTLDTDAWFGYNVQKCASVAASMAAMAFNKFYREAVERWRWTCLPIGNEETITVYPETELSENLKQYQIYISKLEKACFDARIFSIPIEEVTNCIYWRQLDASRNSIQSLGQAYFSHKQLHEKTCADIQDMLVLQKGVNWNDLPTYEKRGSCARRVMSDSETRSKWELDHNIPVFKGDGRKYIEDLIHFSEGD
jgi:tRNA(His) 5'-end guanylyltransferase